MSNHTVSSDESNVSDSLANMKSTFRVRVCLQHYFDDVRARSYILVSRNRRVRWLQDRLRKVFSLSGPFCLCANGHLLPPTEPLGLLCPEDRVEVIPLQDGLFQGQNVENALIINIIKEKGDAKVNTPSALLLDGPDSAHSGTVADVEHFHKYVNRNDPKITNIEMSKGDFVDGITEPTEAESSEPNMESLDSCWNGSMCTDLHVDLDETRTLQKYKQNALALLESRCGFELGGDSAVSEETMPKRARRRVRRRVRRAAPAPAEAEGPGGEGPGGSGGPGGPGPASGAVARNDAASARRPRLVQSLDAVDVRMD